MKEVAKSDKSPVSGSPPISNPFAPFSRDATVSVEVIWGWQFICIWFGTRNESDLISALEIDIIRTERCRVRFESEGMRSCL